MPIAMMKSTELQLKLLILTDGETESQRREINCPSLVSISSIGETIRTQISLYNSTYSRNVLYLPSQLELGVKEKQLSLLCVLYLGHNRTELQKDNLTCVLQNTSGAKY